MAKSKQIDKPRSVKVEVVGAEPEPVKQEWVEVAGAEPEPVKQVWVEVVRAEPEPVNRCGSKSSGPSNKPGDRAPNRRNVAPICPSWRARA